MEGQCTAGKGLRRVVKSGDTYLVKGFGSFLCSEYFQEKLVGTRAWGDTLCVCVCVVVVEKVMVYVCVWRIK